MELIASIDPVWYAAIPAFLWQGWYQQRRRDRAAAMARHPSARRR